MRLKSIAAILAMCAALAPASATNISYTGQFAFDNDVQLFSFTVGAQSTVGLRSYSFAGGTNAAGQVISAGGFDPIVELFNAAGTKIGQQDDGGCSKVGKETLTQECLDFSLTIQLAPGVYTVALSQIYNFSKTNLLADGFFQDGAQNQNYRNGFIDDWDFKRTGAWAFDILNVNPAARVPEPGSLALVGVALVGMTSLRRRRKAA